jgi:hypothetical protein
MLGMVGFFGLSEEQHNGVNSWCRECARTATRDWRDRNRDEINRARREAYGFGQAPPVPEDSGEGGLSHRPVWVLDERFGKTLPSRSGESAQALVPSAGRRKQAVGRALDRLRIPKGFAGSGTSLSIFDRCAFSHNVLIGRSAAIRSFRPTLRGVGAGGTRSQGFRERDASRLLLAPSR